MTTTAEWTALPVVDESAEIGGIRYRIVGMPEGSRAPFAVLVVRGQSIEFSRWATSARQARAVVDNLEAMSRAISAVPMSRRARSVTR